MHKFFEDLICKYFFEKQLLKQQLVPPPAQTPPYLTFPCAECQHLIDLDDAIMPGDAVVVNCPNCNISMTVYAPSLLIRRTKDLPDSINTKIWSELSA